MDRLDKMYYAIQAEVRNRESDPEWIEGVFKDFFGDNEDEVLANVKD